jgi:hypothetical protein
MHSLFIFTISIISSDDRIGEKDHKNARIENIIGEQSTTTVKRLKKINEKVDRC